MNQIVDVAIIGGGPAGTTCATLLLKYNPRLKVTIVEREVFPRDHVGESQLPAIGKVLNEMGVWDKVEVAGFPVKIGATYRWGQSDDLWDFEFLPNGDFHDAIRPARYAGQRTETAFQVDRAIFDKILLDHAKNLGAQVKQPATVRQVLREGDRVEALVLDDGSELRARHYVDASGHTGVLRRAMGVETNSPTSLQNIAIWDYWKNADWAVKIGVGGTRIQILSLGYGWIWFIPLGPTRTSIGLVVPAAYYKSSGKRPEQLYHEAIESDPVVARLLKNASSEGKLTTTKDWSFLSERLSGENWWLAGESAGFADPILSAGMTLAHLGARDVAYAILAGDRYDYDAKWLREWYDESNRTKIGRHIRFADFWYSANGYFHDLQVETQAIARDAGLDMTPEAAWQWLGTGGFIDADRVGTEVGSFTLGAVKLMASRFLSTKPRYEIEGNNTFHLDLENSEECWGARLDNGRIYRHRTHHKNGKFLPEFGVYEALIKATRSGTTSTKLLNSIGENTARAGLSPEQTSSIIQETFVALEAMVCDGWIKATYDPAIPPIEGTPGGDSMIHANRD
jgi:flavin-dependent dehydrogenase